MGQAAKIPDEFCPNCGNFVELICEDTGWCYDCSDRTPPGVTRISWRVKWLMVNGDAIDEVMALQGITAKEAVEVVVKNNRPRCLCCGDEIKRGKKNRDLFCNKRIECRKASSVYSYHVNRRNYIYALPSRSHDEALREALAAAEIIKLTSQVVKDE